MGANMRKILSYVGRAAGVLVTLLLMATILWPELSAQVIAHATPSISPLHNFFASLAEAHSSGMSMAIGALAVPLMGRAEKLEAKRDALREQMAAIHAAAGDNPLTDEQTAQWNALKADRDRLDGSIASARSDAEYERSAAAVEATAGNGEGKVSALNPGALGGGHDREVDKPFASFGEQLLAVRAAQTPGASVTDKRLFAAATGMNQAVPSEGGFMVAPQFVSEVWDGMQADPNNLLGMTDQYTVEGDQLVLNANAETSRATGSRFGGIQGYWINEADQITKSKPKLRQVKVEPQELAVLVYVTEKLLNNAAALSKYVGRAAGSEISFMVGDAIVNGTGAGQPKGLLSAGCKITVNKETSQPTLTFYKANANKMWARLHPRSRANAVWLMNVDVEPTLDDFNTLVKNVAGSENVGGIPSSIYNAEKNTLKGRPIIFTEFNQSLTTEGDVILTDLSAYLTGIRAGGVREAMSMHVRFEYAETAFRFMFAVDGQPWLSSAITPYKGSNTLSSIVTLQAR
jgi:HK97 family phage major capsid protein